MHISRETLPRFPPAAYFYRKPRHVSCEYGDKCCYWHTEKEQYFWQELVWIAHNLPEPELSHGQKFLFGNIVHDFPELPVKADFCRHIGEPLHNIHTCKFIHSVYEFVYWLHLSLKAIRPKELTESCTTIAGEVQKGQMPKTKEILISVHCQTPRQEIQTQQNFLSTLPSYFTELYPHWFVTVIKDACLNYNHPNNQGCSIPSCQKKHVCAVCRADDHGAFSPNCTLRAEASNECSRYLSQDIDAVLNEFAFIDDKNFFELFLQPSFNDAATGRYSRPSCPEEISQPRSTQEFPPTPSNSLPPVSPRVSVSEQVGSASYQTSPSISATVPEKTRPLETLDEFIQNSGIPELHRSAVKKCLNEAFVMVDELVDTPDLELEVLFARMELLGAYETRRSVIIKGIVACLETRAKYWRKPQ